ncbi:hypothetical protein A1Q1_07648 [Trichosporon asahii var. asahii CBS 2479]|uniref:Uncharacterized protein n=1 Tax=Trichosporon asahii var. asahii (strain ATCC 90039 / CBS 2479 / JCM 2466 / KCTC 7840 / NBRC 103889/ NCYC 2677 / UAMH 7654) TaxID=1186058 RepID=J6F2I6_TRIAS|nr:hypothetical protein A1Q1_07648 [Trichosporon asahii var. asahii CBS 2479]EJT51184.1 hypothetical protein A1Q1_07648 [Trichosporon asahii var. asahii CBS 2479]
MPLVLPDGLSSREVPETGTVVGRRGDEVRRVGREGCVPDPALVALERAVEGVLVVLGGPELDGRVGGAGGQVPCVRGEEAACDIFGMGEERRDGHERGRLGPGLDTPHEHGAHVVAGHERAAVACDRDGADRHILGRHELVRARVLAQVPDLHAAHLVAGDQLALVRVDHHVVHHRSLVLSSPSVPHLDRAVLAAGHDPLALCTILERSNIASVPVQTHDRRV